MNRRQGYVDLRKAASRPLLRGESTDRAAIGRTVLALVLVPHLLDLAVLDGDRCPAFRVPTRVVRGGRVGRAGDFAKHGPIQACGGFGTHWSDSKASE